MPGENPLSTSTQERLQLLNALRESELLRELSELLASSLDLTHILQVLVRRTTEVCEVERCAVWLLDESRSLFLPSAYHVSTQRLQQKEIQVADKIWHRSSLPCDDPLIRRLLQENGMLFLEDLGTQAGPALRIIAEKFLVRSIFIMALVREGQAVGILSLDNPGKISTFSAEQQQLARAIGQQAAIAIHNARLYQQAQTERRRAERLIGRAQSIYEVAMAVNSGEDLSTVLGIAAQHLTCDLDADGSAITLLEADTFSVASAHHLQVSSSPPPSNLHTPPTLSDFPHCRRAALEGTPLFVTYEEMEGAEEGWCRQMGLGNVMVIPLMVGTRSRNERDASERGQRDTAHCVGFAFVSYPRSTRSLSPGHYAFAQDIAAQCALAIEKVHILARAHQAAILANERANTLDAVFNAMTEGITVLDLEGHVLISNRTASHFLGVPLKTTEPLITFLKRYPVYTLRGQPVAPEDFPLSRALRGEHIRGERFITRRTDGSERVVEVNVAPLFDSEASHIGFVSAFRDVTEQVRVERRVRRALDTMLHVAEAISGITDIKDILNRLLAMTMTALNCERGVVQLYDQEQQTFTPLFSLGFSAESEESWLEAQKIWLAPEADQYDGFRAQLLDGHATLVCAEQCPQQPNPFLHTMILAAPITHNNQLLGVMILDRSPEPRREQGYRPGATRPLPQPAFKVWDIAVVEGIAQFAGLAIEQARWQQEAEIARINEATMRESNILKDEFLAITAHEFRTPLTVVLAHAQMMARILRRTACLEQEAQAKLDESIETIEQQTHQLTDIVNTFLEVTQLNRGKITLDQQEVRLEEVVTQAVDSCRATSTNHTLSATIEPSERPYLIMGDPARLLQVMTNLLQNAIKYSPLGGPITISLMQRINDEGKTIARLCVEDKGIGIPLDAQPHLFERFYRAPNVHHSKTKGLGVGLYVVAEFVRLHGGTISAESSGIPGEGSRFILTLPLLENNGTTDERDMTNND